MFHECSSDNVAKARFVSRLRELVGLELTAYCLSEQCCALVVLLKPLDMLLTPWQPVRYLGVLADVVTNSLETFKTNLRVCLWWDQILKYNLYNRRSLRIVDKIYVKLLNDYKYLLIACILWIFCIQKLSSQNFDLFVYVQILWTQYILYIALKWVNFRVQSLCIYSMFPEICYTIK